jgi:hypothetical protein
MAVIFCIDKSGLLLWEASGRTRVPPVGTEMIEVRGDEV